MQILVAPSSDSNGSDSLRSDGRRAAASDAPSVEPPVAFSANFPRPVRGFAGRRAELDRVLAHLDDDVLFVVYGVGGIGKTELVYRLMAEARALPEWRDAIPVHLEVRAGATTTRALAELLVATSAPPEPRSGQPTEVAHLNDQLAVLARLLDARPHLLFLDDVHHLPDDAVAEALSYLSRHVRRSRIFVASRREIRLRPNAAPPVVTALGPLDRAAAEQMMDALVDRMQIARPEPGAMMRTTHGSPFHIRRMLVGDAAGDDALERSLDELSRPARRLLLAAAVSPHRPALDVVRRAWSSTDGSPADDWLDESVRELEHRFLIDVEHDRLKVHDLIREPLLRHVTASELTSARADCAALCLGELERGEAPSLIHAVDAIQLLLASGRHDEAWALVERWHRALGAAGSDHLLLKPLEELRVALPARQVSIDLLIARCLVRASLMERADEVLARIGAERTELEDVRHFMLAGEIAQRRGDLSRAEDLFERAVERAPDEGSRFRARLQTAIVAAYRGEGARARELLDAAVAGTSAPSAAQRARTRWARTLSWLFDERYDRATEEARRAREELSGPGFLDLANQLAMLETLAGIGAEDMERARTAVQRLDESGLRQRVTSLYRAIVRYADGEARSASVELLEAHDYLRAHGDTVNAYLAGYYGSAALAEIGRLAEAQALSKRTTELARAAGLGKFVARSIAQGALLAAEAMQCPRAHELATEALEHPFLGPRSRATAHCAHAHAYTIEGDVTLALEHLAHARAAAADHEVACAVIDSENAAVDLVAGKLDEAVERAERVARLLHEGSRHYEAARAQLVLAAAYVARGRRTDLVLAEGVLARTKELATHGELRAILVGAAVVSAALARRSNRGRASDEVLTDALLELDPERGSIYASILRAAIDGGSSWVPPGAVALLAHLGLSNAVDAYLVDRNGRRAATKKDIQRERARRDLVVDETEGLIVARCGEIEIPGRPLQCALLSTLILARGESISAEALYTKVWGVAEYHPLQHRNTLYVAINRLRKSLQTAFPDREVIERAGGGWRLAEGIDGCVAVVAS